MSVPATQGEGVRQPDVRRVLVYRLGSLGDMLVAMPCFHLIERAFPNAERRLLTNSPVSTKAPAAAAVLDGSGLIGSYERYTIGMRNPLDLLALAWRIRRFRPDALIYLAASRGVSVARRDANFFRWMCGIRTSIGVPLTEDMQQPREDASGASEPEASRLARNLSTLGDAALEDPGSWSLRLTSSEQARADGELLPLAGKQFIAVSVGTKVQAKDWGPPNWRALLERLTQIYPGMGLVLAGAPEESAASEFAAAAWTAGPVINLCGKLTPRESAAAFSRAALFIGHDSGPMHLAASVQTPCVAIFAARNKPRVWFPFGGQHRILYHRVDCWGCGLETCLEQRRKCLLSITVDEVVNAVREALPVTMERKEIP